MQFVKYVVMLLIGALSIGDVFAQDYIGKTYVDAIESQSPAIWGIDTSDGAGNDFVPHRVGIKVCKAENAVIVGFLLSDRNKAFYNQKFDTARKPIGFELDVHDESGVFSRADLIDMRIVDGLSGIAYADNYQGDSKHMYTVGVNDPTRLDAGRWYTQTFYFAKHQDVASATFSVQAQLVGNMRVLRGEFRSIYNGFGAAVETALWTWLSIAPPADGNDFFNIRTPQQVFWKNEFFQKGDRRIVQWGSKDEDTYFDFQPYSCAFGTDPYDGGAVATSMMGNQAISIGTGITSTGGSYAGMALDPTVQIATTNLTLPDTDLLDPAGTQITGTLPAGMALRVKARICASGDNITNHRTKNGDGIDTAFQVRLSGGSWTTFDTQSTKDENLRKGDCHGETSVPYTVPTTAIGTVVEFRAKTDADNEIAENNEGDNAGDVQKFSSILEIRVLSTNDGTGGTMVCRSHSQPYL